MREVIIEKRLALPHSDSILFDLGDPEFPVGFDGFFPILPVVSMSKDPVYKDDQFVFFEADIRFPK
ncbi:hypothetical protein [Algoriphagus aquimarinus]|uniref:hypothetical protein n=1 Tax=Algoriphagus aquimarinus TaxID=237018 RepID=UPI001CB99641|nr:hypothetical protein [Algoriphagus aquimarinus]